MIMDLHLGSVVQYVQHPYFYTWFLSTLAGYVLVYIIALIWPKTSDYTRHSNMFVKTLLERSYFSWLLGFLLHLFASLSIFGFLLYKLWNQQNLSSQWLYLLPMFLLIIIDIVLIVNIDAQKKQILKRLR
jgi:uncharacterized membrane protein